MENEIELIPVEGYNSLGRDPASNAILNTDNTAPVTVVDVLLV